MKVHKNQLSVLILAAFFFVIVCVSEYYSNKTVCYTGESNTASVNFCRYQDYDEFLNNKSNDIIIYDDISEIKQEKRKNTKLTFVSGNLKIENGIINRDSEKNLKFMNNSKEISSVTLMMPQDSESQKSETEIPFYFYDYNNSNINRVDLTLDGKIISGLKVKIKYI